MGRVAGYLNIIKGDRYQIILGNTAINLPVKHYIGSILRINRSKHRGDRIETVIPKETWIQCGALNPRERMRNCYRNQKTPRLLLFLRYLHIRNPSIVPRNRFCNRPRASRPAARSRTPNFPRKQIVIRIAAEGRGGHQRRTTSSNEWRQQQATGIIPFQGMNR